MVQRSAQEREEAGKSAGSGKQALAEHFARLEKHQPLPSFDAPGVFEQGPERSGEGSGTGEGGKYRSIASVAPEVTMISLSGSRGRPCQWL